MTQTFARQTLREPVTFSGKGLHSGEPVKVTVSPGDQQIGFRTGSGTRIPIRPDAVVDTSRCTCIPGISTIEHLMSALAGLEITDAEVEVTGGELPGLDGSSAEYVTAFRAAGLTTIGSLAIEGPFARIFSKEDSHTCAISTGQGQWQYDFVTQGTRWPGHQTFCLDLTPESYAAEIAPARTIAFEEELEWIKQHGLGRGLDEHSALVLGQHGYLNASRFADEPVRHKLLDLIGDLYLSGIPVRALNVVAERVGHTANVALARRLAEATKRLYS
jgi:UDP-3-O-[3-hydroxymyristoyl] N-acetylglucosamine deacetylase